MLLEELQAEHTLFRNALISIKKLEPCMIEGNCFYPIHGPEGDYMGEHNVDPLGVIQEMATIARDALNNNV